MFLAWVADICEDQIVESRADEWVQIGHLFWPKIEDLAFPLRNVANNSKVVDEGVEVATSRLKIGWVSQFAKICIFGIFHKRLCEIFNWWISEISSRG